MRLEKEQRNQLLEWVAAGLETGEINKARGEFAAVYAFLCAQVDYYRKTRTVKPAGNAPSWRQWTVRRS
jgi:hypothetical protein